MVQQELTDQISIMIFNVNLVAFGIQDVYCMYVEQAKLREKEKQKKERLLLGKSHGSAHNLRHTTSSGALPGPVLPSAASGQAADERAADKFLAAHFRPQRSSESATNATPARIVSPRSLLAAWDACNRDITHETSH